MGPRWTTPLSRCFALFVLLPPSPTNSPGRVPCHHRPNAASDDQSTMPAAKILGSNEVFRAWTTSPYTKTFRHLLPYNRHLEKRKTFRDPIIKSVKPKDRIKYWNIVPGDQVRIRGEETKSIYEVMSVNRLSNQVRLKVPSSVSTWYSLCTSFGTDAEFHTQERQGRPQEGAICKSATTCRAPRFPSKGRDVRARHCPVRVLVSFGFPRAQCFIVGSSQRGYLLRNPRGTLSSRDGTGNDSL